LGKDAEESKGPVNMKRSLKKPAKEGSKFERVD
jgi:hypothetical protein